MLYKGVPERLREHIYIYHIHVHISEYESDSFTVRYVKESNILLVVPERACSGSRWKPLWDTWSNLAALVQSDNVLLTSCGDFAFRSIPVRMMSWILHLAASTELAQSGTALHYSAHSGNAEACRLHLARLACGKFTWTISKIRHVGRATWSLWTTFPGSQSFAPSWCQRICSEYQRQDALVESCAH